MTLYTSGSEFYCSTPADPRDRRDQDALERENVYGNLNLYSEPSKVHFG